VESSKFRAGSWFADHQICELCSSGLGGTQSRGGLGSSGAPWSWEVTCQFFIALAQFVRIQGSKRLWLNVQLVWCAARAVGPQDSEAVTALMGKAMELGSDRRLTAHWERRLADLREDVQRAEVQQVCTGSDGVSPEEGMLLFWMGAAFYAIHKVSDVCLFLCRLWDEQREGEAWFGETSHLEIARTVEVTLDQERGPTFCLASPGV
jgi:hypothetical protein